MAQLPGDGVEQIKKYDDEARHGGEFIVPAPGQNDDVAANPPATAKGQSPGVSGTQTKPAAKRGPVKLIKRNPK